MLVANYPRVPTRASLALIVVLDFGGSRLKGGYEYFEYDFFRKLGAVTCCLSYACFPRFVRMGS